MFRKPNPRIAEIDETLTKILAHMDDLDLPYSDEYIAASKSYALLNEERTKLLSNRFSKDNLVTAGASFVTVLVVIIYESKDQIWTSKSVDVARKAFN